MPVPSARILICCLVLAACGTPQEQCISYNTRDLRTVEKLIAETETNIARGYAMEKVTISRPAWDNCVRTRINRKGKPVPYASYCLEQESDTVERPRTIDPAAERRKLAGLQEKRRELMNGAEAAVAACRARYPE